MALNIKNKEACALVEKLAKITGESKTEAITEALRERLERAVQKKKREGMAERLMKIGRDSAARVPESIKSIPHGDLLYDEDGLPK